MGKTKNTPTKKFTLDDVNNKELIIKMLQHEEQLAKSEVGKNLYRNPLNNPFTSLTVEKALNRLTLSDFGFENDDESVENYRLIFKTYFKSPDNYDREIINASYYMRNNKCVFFKSKKLIKGDTIPNCELYTLDNNSTSIYDIVFKNNEKHVIVAGFSLS